MKPIIIAIIGPSCCGKTTFMRKLYWEFSQMPFLTMFPDVYYIISSTTRPPRRNEENNKDYHFLSEEKFQDLINRNCFLEWTEFRKWKYGTDKLNVCDKPGAINIGVFNLQGIDSLIKQKEFEIIPIYLKVHWKERLQRAIKREGHLTFEILRRLYTDFKDFRKEPNYNNLLCYKDNYNIDDTMKDILGKIEQFNQ